MTPVVTRILAILVAAAASLDVAAGANTTQYNVILIASDDLKVNLGAYGDPVADTPNIDALMNRGVRFENMHCQKSECAPSRSSMIAGRRPDSLKVWAFDPVFREYNPKLMTLPGHLRYTGNYRAVAVGKILDNRNFNVDDSVTPDLCGQDIYLNADMVHCSWDEYISPNIIRDEDVCNGTNALRWPVSEAEEADYDQDDHFVTLMLETNNQTLKRSQDYCIRTIAVEKLRGLAQNYTDNGQPFFLGVGFMKPHMPWIAPYYDFEHFRTIPDSMMAPPPEISDPLDNNTFWTDQSSSWTKKSANSEIAKYANYEDYNTPDRARAYHAAVRFVDRQVGEFLDVLNNEIDPIVRNRTMVIFWGDHGYHLGSFGLWAKKTVLEQATRVPFSIMPPPEWSAKNNFEAGKATYSVTDTVDMYPTVVDILGLPSPNHTLAGTSLVPILKNVSAQVRAASVNEYESWENSNYVGYSIRTMYYRLIVYMKLDTSTGEFDTSTETKMELYQYSQPGDFEALNVIANSSFADVKARMLSLVPTNSSDTDWTNLLNVDPWDVDQGPLSSL